MNTAAYSAEYGHSRLRTITGIAKPLIAMTGVLSVVSGITVALFLGQSQTMYEFIYSDLMLIDLVVIAYAIVFFASAIAMSFWLYRAHANLLEADTPGAHTRAGWAIAWYFIPIANLFKPYQSMKELWQGSVDRHIDANETAPGLIWLWWISWIVSSASGFGEEFTSLDVIAFGAAALSAAALYRILDRITAAQPTMSITSTFE